MTNANETLSKIAADLDLCDLALGVLPKQAHRRFKVHKAACLKAIKEIAPVSAEIEAMSDDELLAELRV